MTLSPSWVELVGRNAAAETVCVSGSMRMTGQAGDQTPGGDFRFWHGAGGRWRVEHGGEVVYMSSVDGEAFVRIDNEIQCHRGGFGVVHLGSMFSPLDLLGPESVLRRMSVQVNVSEPCLDVVGGRAAWSIAVTQSSGVAVDLALDSRTGVLVRLTGPEDAGGFEVLHLTEHGQLGAELFRWDGPSVDAPMSARRRPAGDREQRGASRVAELTALVAALDRPQEVLEVIVTSKGGRAAREAIADLLGVSAVGAEAVASMALMGFRSDVAQGAREELAALQSGSLGEGE
ncbi:hypothetical protein [Rhodococcus erythropolis]|uniref:hypothetical protein n=1 Tax=Rhodococcus erythropolis TaxID=1833 RepID=UPI00222729C3|nr:hypothetical protein [Rhodococcus erythropolis]MCW2295522.1 hypothetical protein [Rhodococcus erythropolis]